MFYAETIGDSNKTSNFGAKRFDYDLAEYLESHVVKLTKFASMRRFCRTLWLPRRLLAKWYF